MTKKSTTTVVHLPPDVLKDAKQAARDRGLSFSAYVSELIEHHVEAPMPFRLLQRIDQLPEAK